ncbi:hypothetical protein HDU76_000272 [Blyttiomyces sp. JEL0837]|nr:hypothetical protein HDU76_000272 [Blyttiomyces sp. JEL0837]
MIARAPGKLNQAVIKYSRLSSTIVAVKGTNIPIDHVNDINVKFCHRHGHDRDLSGYYGFVQAEKGFTVGTNIPASKYRTNFTLATFMPYSLGDFYGTILQRDAEIEFAVNETNSNPNILPNTYIKVIRINSFDPENSANYDYIDSGGYAVGAALRAYENGANAAIGELYSKTTRMNFGAGYGHYVARLLKSFNVKRVALVSGYDALSVAGRSDVRGALKQANIQILTDIFLPADVVQRKDFNGTYQTIKSVDASAMGLISPKIVWYTWNPPMPDDNDLVGAFGPNAINLYQGIMNCAQDSIDLTASNIQSFNDTWNRLGSYNPRFAQISSVSFQYNTGAYDCAKTMFLGLHQFMERNPSFTPEMLANRSLNKYLKPSVFADTGYSGFTYKTIKLNENGDLNMWGAIVQVLKKINIARTLNDRPQLYFAGNYALATYMINDRTTAFGLTDGDGITYTPFELQPPIFFGGSNTPPPDGPVDTILTIAWSSAYGVIHVILSLIGMISAIILLILVQANSKLRPIRAISPLFTSVFAIGSFIVFLSFFFFMGPPSTFTCNMRMWLQVVGAGLTYGPLIVKNARVYVLFSFKNADKRLQKDDVLMVFLSLIVATGVIILALWTTSVDPNGYHLASDESFRTNTCIVIPDKDTGTVTNLVYAILAYIIALLLATGYLSYVTSSVYDSFSESAFLSSAMLLGILALAITAATSMGSMEPSAISLLARNVVIFIVAIANEVFLFLPKWMEVLESWKKDKKKGHGTQSTMTTATSSAGHITVTTSINSASSASDVSGAPSSVKGKREAVKSIPHMNLGAACISFRHTIANAFTIPIWTEWRKTGITIYSHAHCEKNWIVFDFDGNSISRQMSESDTIQQLDQRENFVKLVIGQNSKSSSTAFQCILEFETAELVKTFVDQWNSFRTSPPPAPIIRGSTGFLAVGGGGGSTGYLAPH